MFSSCYSEKKSEQMIITNLILFSRFFITIPYYICIRSFASKGEGFVGALMRSLHSPWGSWRGAKDVFLEYIFAKFGVIRVFFRFVGRFFEIKTLPLHKNNGDVLPSLWV